MPRMYTNNKPDIGDIYMVDGIWRSTDNLHNPKWDSHLRKVTIVELEAILEKMKEAKDARTYNANE